MAFNFKKEFLVRLSLDDFPNNAKKSFYHYLDGFGWSRKDAEYHFKQHCDKKDDLKKIFDSQKKKLGCSPLSCVVDEEGNPKCTCCDNVAEIDLSRYIEKDELIHVAYDPELDQLLFFTCVLHQVYCFKSKVNALADGNHAFSKIAHNFVYNRTFHLHIIGTSESSEQTQVVKMARVTSLIGENMSGVGPMNLGGKRYNRDLDVLYRPDKIIEHGFGHIEESQDGNILEWVMHVEKYRCLIEFCANEKHENESEECATYEFRQFHNPDPMADEGLIYREDIDIKEVQSIQNFPTCVPHKDRSELRRVLFDIKEDCFQCRGRLNYAVAGSKYDDVARSCYCPKALKTKKIKLAEYKDITVDLIYMGHMTLTGLSIGIASDDGSSIEYFVFNDCNPDGIMDDFLARMLVGCEYTFVWSKGRSAIPNDHFRQRVQLYYSFSFFHRVKPVKFVELTDGYKNETPVLHLKCVPYLLGVPSFTSSSLNSYRQGDLKPFDPTKHNRSGMGKPYVLKDVSDLRLRINAGKPVNAPPEIKALLKKCAPSKLKSDEIRKLNQYVTDLKAKTQSTVDDTVAKPTEKPPAKKRKVSDGKKQSNLDNFLGKNVDNGGSISGRTRSKKSKSNVSTLARIAHVDTPVAPVSLARIAPIDSQALFNSSAQSAQSNSPSRFDPFALIDSQASFNSSAQPGSPPRFGSFSQSDLSAQSGPLARHASNDPVTIPGNKHPVGSFIDFYKEIDDEKFECLDCKKPFKALARLKAHYNQTHGPIDKGLPSELFSITDNLKFKCKQCDEVNGTSTEARNHFYECKNGTGTVEERKKQWNTDGDFRDRQYMKAIPARREKRKKTVDAYNKTETHRKASSTWQKTTNGKKSAAKRNNSALGRATKIRYRNKKRKTLGKGKPAFGKTHRVIAPMKQSENFFERFDAEAKAIKARGEELSGVFVTNEMSSELKAAINSNLHDAFKSELFDNLSAIYPIDSCKQNYVYLLCDTCMWHSGMTFGEFINSIFYVGRGVDMRWLQHFFEASLCEKYKDQLNKKERPKEDTINGTWKKGNTIKVLRFYVGDKAELADFIEFAMILTIGMNNLTNNKLDGATTTPAHYSVSDVCAVGVHVLGTFFETHNTRANNTDVTKETLEEHRRLGRRIKYFWTRINLEK